MCLAVTLALAAGVARAQAPSTESALTLPAAWSAPGTPGWVPDATMGSGLPTPYLGLVAGGFALRDPFATAPGAWPGIAEAEAPLAWYDSVAVVVGEGAGWRGFDATLAEARAFAAPPATGKVHSIATLVGGTAAVTRNGLLVARTGTRGWLRAGAIAEKRGGSGALDLAGHHLWFAQGELHRGRQSLHGSYSQRGLGESEDNSFVEGGRGEGGEAGWSWRDTTRSAAVTLRRAHDTRISALPLSLDPSGFYTAHREAEQTALEATVAHGDSLRGEGLRLELTEGRVDRSHDNLIDTSATAGPYRWDERTAWLAARVHRPWMGGALELQLGGGWTSAPERREERLQMAPSLAWRVVEGGIRMRLYAERVVTPVWSDLQLGHAPFLQDVWMGGLDAGAGDRAHAWFDGGVAVARAGARATIRRFPIRDLSLRVGWLPDTGRADFELATLRAGVRPGPFALDAEGFALRRDPSENQADVEPSVGARGGIETRFRLFTGDLGVRLRGEAALVGLHSDDPANPNAYAPRPLPAYGTFAASVVLTLGDATIDLRGENLEGTAHPATWTDLQSPTGDPAPGAGRRFRASVVWPLFN